MSFPGIFTDHLGRTVSLPSPPQRIISLCPSQTETLVAFGIGERLIGKTRFCIHPKAQLRQVKNVGGTKNVDFERIRALQPDLIIGEKEENTAEMIAALEQEWPVFMTDVRDVESARQMVLDLGGIVDSEVEATKIAAAIDRSMENIPCLEKPVTCIYLIWKNPWMAAGSDTFIDSMLKKCGFNNVAGVLPGRYPMLDVEVFLQKNPRVVFLSSEPFPFKSSHIAEIQEIVPNSLVKIVDGEMFSWYGSHMIGVENYLKVLLEEMPQ